MLVLTNSFYGREDRGLTERLLTELPVIPGIGALLAGSGSISAATFDSRTLLQKPYKISKT